MRRSVTGFFARSLARACIALAALLPGAGGAQAPADARVQRVAVMATAPDEQLAGPQPGHPGYRAFVEALRERGWRAGENLALDARPTPPGEEAMAAMAKDWIAKKSDAMVVLGGGYALVAAEATETVPIVMIGADDPVRLGLAHSLERPGRNLTGLWVDAGARTESARLELLLEAVPGAKRIAYLGPELTWRGGPWAEGARSAALRRGVELVHVEMTREDVGKALDSLRASKPDAFFVEWGRVGLVHRDAIGAFARESGIPGACAHRSMAERGCLIAYDEDVLKIWRAAAGVVDRVLRGEKAGEIPIERPDTGRLVLNLGTARALGIRLPPALMRKAEQTYD